MSSDLETILNPAEIAKAIMDENYGAGSEWGEQNRFGESGFTRAQAETDITQDDIELLIQQAINRDRAQFFDTDSSTSIQHAIDTGRYLVLNEKPYGDHICGRKPAEQARVTKCDPHSKT